jgi:hypothetical protein
LSYHLRYPGERAPYIDLSIHVKKASLEEHASRLRSEASSARRALKGPTPLIPAQLQDIKHSWSGGEIVEITWRFPGEVLQTTRGEIQRTRKRGLALVLEEYGEVPFPNDEVEYIAVVRKA